MPDPTTCPPRATAAPVPLIPGASRASVIGVTRRGSHRRPLPDAAAIRPIAVPTTAPPYDDTRLADRAARRAPRLRTSPARPAAELTELTGDFLRADRSGADWPGLPRSGTAGHWPSQFAQVLAETLAGTRPPSQLTPWTTEQARKRISQLGQTLATAHQPRVRRVIVRSPADGVLEMAVIVSLGSRVRALAVRLERQRPPEEPTPCPPSPPRPPGPSGPPGEPGPASQAKPAGQPGPEAQARPSGQAGAQSANPAPRWCCTAVEAA